jgi:DNA repair ATPase RecN
MNRAFYSLPEPREVGLKWKPYQQAREKVSRIERRLRETQNERARLEQEIRELGDAEIRELSQAILRGEDDPTARHDEHAKLVERLRDLKREETAIAQALPVAEGELRQTVFENQHKCKEEADGALEKAIAEEHKAYAKAIELLEGPRARRMYLEALSGWVRYPTPSFGTPSDVVARSAIQRLEGDAVLAEEKMGERAHNERLALEQERAAIS